ncbi:GNAT family N-acetyltransferase, partial [Gaetbulibacter sp. PBL-D1]|uniref:GNAT family N-acetyltransferase n=1 Tax=Gaetbulibacter sp. PBL-D1 TaxID=3422594 RepID=UPI003D2EBB85
MENAKFTFKTLEGIPSKNNLNEILTVYKSVKEYLLTLLCYHQKQLIGFKIGYKYNASTFYSWVGGVLPDYRKNGIGKQLSQLQEQAIKQKGYNTLRTKSMNRFKPMMILNLKNGFDIKSVYTNET